MALPRPDLDRMTTMQHQPTAMEGSLSLGEELLAEADEPPDEQQPTPRPAPAKPAELGPAVGFSKTRPTLCERKESLLTQALHSESDSQSDDDGRVGLKRGFSTTSTWSTPSIASTEFTSDAGFTSPVTRTSSPSPPLPATIHCLPPLYATINQKDSDQTLKIRHADHIENVNPLPNKSSEHSVEAGLGRKRCITFACGRKDETMAAPMAPPKPQEEKPAAPPLRRPTIKFSCDAKTPVQPGKPRMASPAPPVKRLSVPSKGTPRSHRGSDSTVKNDSPKSVRKLSVPARHLRKNSENSDIGRREATRFHEFASSEEEIDEWTQEQTCHKTRLTITDTLKVENGLRKLGQEVEEEALEDEEEEENEMADEDEDLDLDDEEEDEEDEEDVDDRASVVSLDVSDGGFQTDDEGGFAVSDDESDAGSDYQWWAPGRAAAVASGDQLEHIRPSAGRRSPSASSTGSIGSVAGPPKMFSKSNSTPSKKRKPVNIGRCSPELPDSTDFVCGTLDEDRPLEEAYYSALEQRRAAKHKLTPQDIDPTFPTSDPEMDEEDEDDEPEETVEEESDQHVLMHGQLDQIDEVDGRGRRRPASKRSPVPSPKRLRSPPPPTKRGQGQGHRSPPPRRTFGASPKRFRSPPPPAARLRSPPPHRRTSLAVTSNQQNARIQFAGVGQGPRPTVATSLPRPPTLFHQVSQDDEDECESPTDTFKRGPMDIKAGTALKRQRRKEKLYQKHCRKACKEKERRPAPGKGAERMREMGIGLAAYRGKRAEPVHVLSY